MQKPAGLAPGTPPPLIDRSQGLGRGNAVYVILHSQNTRNRYVQGLQGSYQGVRTIGVSFYRNIGFQGYFPWNYTFQGFYSSKSG